MDRRSFLRSMIGGVAAAAAVRTFPFRVFSFPKNIVVPRVALGEPLKVGDVILLPLRRYPAAFQIADEIRGDYSYDLDAYFKDRVRQIAETKIFPIYTV